MFGSRNTLTPLNARDDALLLSREISTVGAQIAAVLRRRQRETRHMLAVTHYTVEQTKTLLGVRTTYRQHTKEIDVFPLDGIAVLDLNTGLVYMKCASIFFDPESGERYEGYHTLGDAIAYRAQPDDQLASWLQSVQIKLTDTLKHLGP